MIYFIFRASNALISNPSKRRRKERILTPSCYRARTGASHGHDHSKRTQHASAAPRTGPIRAVLAENDPIRRQPTPPSTRRTTQHSDLSQDSAHSRATIYECNTVHVCTSRQVSPALSPSHPPKGLLRVLGGTPLWIVTSLAHPRLGCVGEQETCVRSYIARTP